MLLPPLRLLSRCRGAALLFTAATAAGHDGSRRHRARNPGRSGFMRADVSTVGALTGRPQPAIMADWRPGLDLIRVDRLKFGIGKHSPGTTFDAYSTPFEAPEWLSRYPGLMGINPDGA